MFIRHLLRCLFAALLCAVISGIACAADAESVAPVARGAVLDLRGWDFDRGTAP